MTNSVELRNPLEFVESFEDLAPKSMPRFVGYAISYNAGDVEEWHYHEIGQLLYAISGTMRVSTPDSIMLIAPTMAVWLPPGVHHKIGIVSNTEMRIIFARPDSLPLDSDNSRVLAVSPLLRELILAVIPTSLSVTNTRNCALFDLMAAELAGSQEVPLSLPMPLDRRIRPMAEGALANPGEISSISAWADTAPASRKTVERLFVRETGLTPSQWLKQTRLIFAVVALAEGHSVTSIALDLGYATPSSFTYMFRQALGIVPSKFSRQLPTPTSL